MKAIVNTAPGRLEWCSSWPQPQPGPGQVRIRTAACGICATDLKMIDGWDRTGFPAIPGHEWSGTVDAVGAGVDPRLVGQRCVAENVLADGSEVGFEHPGGYGEYLLTSAAHVHTLPPDSDLAVATLIEPLAVAVRAMRRLRLEDCSAALVFGDGPIGLLVLLLLRRAGVEEVILVGGRPGRLATARSWGAAGTFDYHRLGPELSPSLLEARGGRFPNVIEASGSAQALQAALDLVSPGGRVLVVGDYDEARADFAWNHLLHNEIELIGSCASAGAWPEAVRLAVEGALPLASLVTQRLPAAQFPQGIAMARSHRGDVIKVVLEWMDLGTPSNITVS
ncbi:MAG: zinc-binding dehydrogenase [Anaerolineae bacterium]|nr:zinc-binding dehydrogenase [Anaerolineae bacterium]